MTFRHKRAEIQAFAAQSSDQISRILVSVGDFESMMVDLRSSPYVTQSFVDEWHTAVKSGQGMPDYCIPNNVFVYVFIHNGPVTLEMASGNRYVLS